MRLSLATASLATADTVNQMAGFGRGLVCVALEETAMKRLGIPMMVAQSPIARRHAFGASIEASEGVTTGISAADRARTIAVVADPESGPADIVMPGHVFPIQVRKGGVLLTPGVPEAALDLCVMAGLPDGAVLCAVLDDEGEVADAAALKSVAEAHDLPIATVAQVVAHRLGTEIVVERVAERGIESGYGGAWRAIVYRNDFRQRRAMALVAGEVDGDEPVPVRVHSQCLTGDVFGSTRCDCGDQLALAVRRIAEEGRGAVVYMHQEGRGIGLANKIRAYALQDKGRDTVEANLELGFGEDLRDYGITAQIIKDLGIRRVKLLTNNPQKMDGLAHYGVEVVERSAIETEPHDDNIGYLRTKRNKLGHLLDEDSLRKGGLGE